MWRWKNPCRNKIAQCACGLEIKRVSGICLKPFLNLAKSWFFVPFILLLCKRFSRVHFDACWSVLRNILNLKEVWDTRLNPITRRVSLGENSFAGRIHRRWLAPVRLRTRFLLEKTRPFERMIDALASFRSDQAWRRRRNDQWLG